MQKHLTDREPWKWLRSHVFGSKLPALLPPSALWLRLLSQNGRLFIPAWDSPLTRDPHEVYGVGGRYRRVERGCAFARQEGEWSGRQKWLLELIESRRRQVRWEGMLRFSYRVLACLSMTSPLERGSRHISSFLICNSYDALVLVSSISFLNSLIFSYFRAMLRNWIHPAFSKNFLTLSAKTTLWSWHSKMR